MLLLVQQLLPVVLPVDIQQSGTQRSQLSHCYRTAVDPAYVFAVGLDLPVLSRYPGELSGGMGQRVMIALALLNNPKVLIADEPTSALDPEMVQEVLSVIRALADEGRTMLLVTHEMNFARQVSSEVVFLHQGLIEEQGPPSDVLDNPQSERLRQFLSGNLK